MNIFYLNHDQRTCAEWQVNSHIIKMTTESCQILSTAHRVLDGVPTLVTDDKGRLKTVLVLPDYREHQFYKTTHVNHPSVVWARTNVENYRWLAELTVALAEEYTYRYGNVHKCEWTGLINMLQRPPTNIPDGEFFQPPPTMQAENKVEGDSIKSYHNQYNNEKRHILGWKNREIPPFINEENRKWLVDLNGG